MHTCIAIACLCVLFTERIHTYTHMHGQIHMRKHIWGSKYTHIHMHIHTHTHTYIYIYIHTHTHSYLIVGWPHMTASSSAAVKRGSLDGGSNEWYPCRKAHIARSENLNKTCWRMYVYVCLCVYVCSYVCRYVCSLDGVARL